jgi:hypothetical protein
MIAAQVAENNFSITNESLSELIGKAFWWGANKGPVILFCGPVLAQALFDSELDEFWIDILPPVTEPLNPEIVDIGPDVAELRDEIKDKIKLCCERHEILGKLLK